MSTYIIAEAGVNHNGDIVTAKKMIDAAAEAGADCVKFQVYNPDELVGICYALQNCRLISAMLLELMLHRNDIDFLCSAFDIGSLDMLSGLGLDTVKIPSGQITNCEFLEHAAQNFENVIVSTGMCDFDEVSQAVDILKGSKISLLHCNSAYPTPMEDVNLRAMNTLRAFNVPIGLSDHTLGIEIPIAAVAMGAEIIEKHFTLSRKLEGLDQKMSVEPNEFKAMVSAIKNIEKAMGTGEKKVTKSEMPTLCRRSF